MTAVTRWFNEGTHGDDLITVSKRCGVDLEQLRLEFVEDRVSADTVIAIAKAYGKRTTIGLVLCGLIPRDDITAKLTQEELIFLSTLDEILDEVSRRVEKKPELAKQLILEISRSRAT